MFAIIMSGGMGRRMLSKEEKPMLMVKGKPMIDHVFTALKNSNCFEKILIVLCRFSYLLCYSFVFSSLTSF